jgi:hypothetical protein
MSLMERAMNKNSPNMCDHMLTFEDNRRVQLNVVKLDLKELTVSFVHQKIDSQHNFDGSIVRYPLRMKGLNCKYVGA